MSETRTNAALLDTRRAPEPDLRRTQPLFRNFGERPALPGTQGPDVSARTNSAQTSASQSPVSAVESQGAGAAPAGTSKDKEPPTAVPGPSWAPGTAASQAAPPWTSVTPGPAAPPPWPSTAPYPQNDDRALPFRQAALQAREAPEPIEPLLAIDTSSWSVVLVCLSLVAALVLGTAFGKVEITVTSDGVVRAVTGVRPIRARLNGAVVSVAASSGALVQVGTPIAVLDSTELEARHRRLEELVRGLRAKTDREQALSDELHEKRMKGLQSMEATLRARLDLKRQVLGDQGVRTQQLKNLQGVGAASLHEVFGAREASHRTREELFGMQERLATLNVEMADRQESHAQSSLTRHRALEEQETELREVEDLIRLAEIRSPEGGRLESLTLTPGQVVEQGAVIAQLVPLDALRTAIVFVPAEEANFVAAGQAALVEFPSLSVSEFGAAPATVTRVSSDVATPEEIVAALGPRPDSASRSMFRVELRLENSRLFDRMQPHLRSGTLVRARLQTRTRRVASMLFDVVHNWIYR